MLFVERRFGEGGHILFPVAYTDVTAPASAARQGSTVQADGCSLFPPLWAAEAGAAHDVLCTGTPLGIKESTQGLGELLLLNSQSRLDG